MPVVAEVCQSFCFDNGAFSCWKQGGTLDHQAYFEWCVEWHQHPGFDWCLIPDVIDGDGDANDDLVAWWVSQCSTRRLQRLMLRSVPVYHMHESVGRMGVLADLGTTFFDRVAIGSSGEWPTPGTDGWWVRMGEIMESICDEQGRPRCRLHGLRMMAPDIFTHLPLASADSTNVAQNGQLVKRFGMYPPATQSQRRAVIADRIEACNSVPVWTNAPEQQLMLSAR